jgi:hypothetical protein
LGEREKAQVTEASERADNYVVARKNKKNRRSCTSCGNKGHLDKFCRVSDTKETQKATDAKEEGAETKIASGKGKNTTCFLVEKWAIMLPSVPRKLRWTKVKGCREGLAVCP